MTVEQIERTVQQARKAGDIDALIHVTRAALLDLDGLLAAHPARPDVEKTLILNAIRRTGYNVAADIYPGWEIGTPQRSEAELSAAIEFAKKSAEAVEQTGLGSFHQGNAAWLLGALDLARGQRDSALRAFRHTAELFAQEANLEMQLMAAGYAAIASRSSADFDAAISDLEKLSSEDATALTEQLVTARQIFSI